MIGDSNAQLPDVISYALTKYRQALEARNNEARAAGLPELPVQEELDKLQFFTRFARDYYAKHRAVLLLGAMDSNYGFRLSNGDEVSLSPAMHLAPGAMLPSISVPVTGHQTIREMARAGDDPNAIPITGAQRPGTAIAGTVPVAGELLPPLPPVVATKLPAKLPQRTGRAKVPAKAKTSARGRPTASQMRSASRRSKR